MLDTFRRLLDSLIVKILLGLLILSFGVWGVGDMLRHPGGKQVVATVGSASISVREFRRELRRETEQAQQALGEQATPEVLQSLSLPQRALGRLIDRALIRQESEALGLSPSDADVVRRIRGSEMFQNAQGAFDKARFEAVLRNAGMSEKDYVEQLRQDMASRLLDESLSGAVPVSAPAMALAARTLYDARQEQRTATLYMLGAAQAGDIPSPGAAQVEAYYKAHGDLFTAPEYRTVSYVALTEADAAGEVTLSDDDLRAAYKERIAEFSHPERRTLDQLIYDNADKAKQASAQLKAGKSFAQVAAEGGELNGDRLSLGEIERSQLMEGARDAVFGLPAGQSTAPIQTPFGWNIFHVSAIEAPSTDTFEQARPVLEKELRQRGADDALNRISNRLEDALAGGSTLAEAAKDLKLAVHRVGPVDRQGMSADDGKHAQVPDLDKFLDTAFRTAEKTESGLVTARGGVYYILYVESVSPEHVRPLTDVKAQVVAAWQKEEREKRLGVLAQDVAKQFAGAGRGAAIGKYHLQPVAVTVRHDSRSAGGVNLSPELVNGIFMHKPGEATDAFPLPSGDDALAVVTGIIPAPPPESAPAQKAVLTDIETRLSNDLRNEIEEQYLHYLASKYKVSVNAAVLQAVEDK